MMKQEFEQLIGKEVSYETFRIYEEMYHATPESVTKQKFVEMLNIAAIPESEEAIARKEKAAAFRKEINERIAELKRWLEITKQRIVDAGGRRSGMNNENEKAKYMAALTVQPLLGNVGFTVSVYGYSIEMAKKIAMQNLNELCAKYKFPIGEIWVMLSVEKSGAHIDFDETTAQWDGKEAKINWDVAV